MKVVPLLDSNCFIVRTNYKWMKRYYSEVWKSSLCFFLLCGCIMLNLWILIGSLCVCYMKEHSKFRYALVHYEIIIICKWNWILSSVIGSLCVPYPSVVFVLLSLKKQKDQSKRTTEVQFAHVQLQHTIDVITRALFTKRKGKQKEKWTHKES